MAKRYQIINVLRMDYLMHTFEELQDKFAADSDLELKLQD